MHGLVIHALIQVKIYGLFLPARIKFNPYMDK